jgi:L-fuconolactonase
VILDSHVHLWLIDRPECTWPTAGERAIFRDHRIDDLASRLLDNGVQSAILVQSQEHDSDTSWLLDQARDASFISGVVGWCDLESYDASERIAELASRPKLLGLRPMVQHLAADYFDRPQLKAPISAMVEGGLVLDALVRVPHLPALRRLATRFPELRIVIDHAAKPRISDASGFESWRSAIAALAELPNVRCKASGLLTECGSKPPEAIAPYMTELLSLFGAERLMWGSDWPVVNMTSDYESWFELARSMVPANVHHQLFAVTAAETYRISMGERP